MIEYNFFSYLPNILQILHYINDLDIIFEEDDFSMCDFKVHYYRIETIS